jgi:hypothetical protein
MIQTDALMNEMGRDSSDRKCSVRERQGMRESEGKIGFASERERSREREWERDRGLCDAAQCALPSGFHRGLCTYFTVLYGSGGARTRTYLSSGWGLRDRGSRENGDRTRLADDRASRTELHCCA